ncbi:disulfide bond formation protein DsbD [Agaricicola taiwanensis]|uniref:Disulfide bond formation protein DsbD n=1 Tax=Agaricicola taiwanensis TaxID=591372 RepID=A0A8J2VNI3_9RHOB|nr:DsbA family protein [Agaricicola taiwanensis]GGE34809.1 disulfide bond formation protein DsbD [Agaricicola taiwanensis]
MRATRREFLNAAAGLAIVAGLAHVTGLSVINPAAAQSPSVEDLMAEGPLPDKALGDANAPVTIVEYASLTCSHCGDFHATVYPVLKSKYIDTGKVRFIFREFPLDNFAAAGFMLARCAEGDQYFPIVDAFFNQQKALFNASEPFAWLTTFAKQVGFTQESLEACLGNQELLDQVQAVRQRASEKYGVESTPTFFINGKIQRGAMSIEELEKILQPLLPS